MVVICEECGLKYQIDPSKIAGDKARFKCQGCSTSIVVDKRMHLEKEEIESIDDVLLSGETATDESAIESMPIDRENGDYKAGPEVSTQAMVGDQQSQTEKKEKGLGLTAKVILLMLLVSLLPGAIYFLLSFKQSGEQITIETNKTGKMVSELLASGVDEWIDKNVRALNAIANLPEIKSMNQFDQETVLKALQAEYSWMYLVFTTDDRGMNVARSDGKELRDYSNRQYVKDVTGGSDLAWQNLIGKTSKKPALVLAVPIKSGDIVVGVLAAAMTRDAISEIITSFRQGNTGTSFLVDQTGKAVAHQNNAYVQQEKTMDDHPLVQAAKSGSAKRTEFTDLDGQERIGFAQKTRLGWTLAIQQDKSEAFAPLKKAQNFAFILLGITVVVILVIAYLSAKAIVTPIRNLTDAANRISIGDLDVEIKRPSKDEIGDLADAIMRMQDSIRLSISRLKRKRR